LLIGNKAHFSAVLQLEYLKQEIWEERVSLGETSESLIEEILEIPDLTCNALISQCMKNTFVRDRGIIITGKSVRKGNDFERVRLYSQGSRITVNQTARGFWHCSIKEWNPKDNSSLRIEGAQNNLKICVPGLFTTDLFLHRDNRYRLINEKSDTKGFSFLDFFDTEETELQFGSSTIKFEQNDGKTATHTSIEWEARYNVVKRYQKKVNRLTGRDQIIPFRKLKSHWRQKSILPLKLAGNLTAHEYAKLIDEIEPDSPLQVSSQAIRHYPMGSLASHILGYVGSGYEADDEGLEGQDLGTFEIKGKKGKEGIEVFFDTHLRGKDGSDIWRISPSGLRFELMESIPAQKGSPIRLSIDSELQGLAEQSLQQMSQRVATRRILPDDDWLKTIEKRTRRELIRANEKGLSPDLLLNSFKDAPFPLSGRQASTVAGFKGTSEDADRLLRLLYAKGVLAKANPEVDEYVLASPPPPPGAAVLIHLKTREVLVLASKPNYNLQEFSPILSQSTFDKIERAGAWLPRALHPGYAPASPFKLVTALAGFRQKVLDPDEKLLCAGKHKGMICHVFPGSHGELTFREAIARSCNVYFYRIGERVGHFGLIQEARRLNMHLSPSIQLPSTGSPIVPDPEWKKKATGVDWTLEDTFNISIGQGGLSQSPLQIACMMAKLASNDLSFEPSILFRSPPKTSPPQPLGIQESSLRAIYEGMHLATTKGTAHRCKIEGIDIAGKTGTGQWRNHNMKLNLAWFVGFAPLENPEVAIAVLIEGIIPQDKIRGGLTATPVARDILQAYFDNTRKKLARDDARLNHNQ
jgi:cell division protein FtsI/penicillin-binding protein 2